MATFIGKDYRLISLVRIDMPFFIHFALLAEGYNVTFELIQLIYILLKVKFSNLSTSICITFYVLIDNRRKESTTDCLLLP